MDSQCFTHGFRMNFPWISHGFPWIPMDFPCTSHGYPMDFPWISHRFPMDLQWISHGFSMDFPWIPHGFPMDFPWISHRFTMNFPWFSQFQSRLPLIRDCGRPYTRISGQIHDNNYISALFLVSSRNLFAPGRKIGKHFCTSRHSSVNNALPRLRGKWKPIDST